MSGMPGELTTQIFPMNHQIIKYIDKNKGLSNFSKLICHIQRLIILGWKLKASLKPFISSNGKNKPPKLIRFPHAVISDKWRIRRAS